MPKSKPTQVIVHRIELQEKERDMLEAVVAGNTVKNVVIPVAVVAGVTTASYIGYKTARGIIGWTDDAIDQAKEDFNEWADDPKRKVAFTAASIPFRLSPLGQVISVGRWFIS